jgi:hypothetical protein
LRAERENRAKTDAEGRFTIRGLGPNLTVELEVHDDRVELRTFTVDTADTIEATGLADAFASFDKRTA